MSTPPDSPGSGSSWARASLTVKNSLSAHAILVRFSAASTFNDLTAMIASLIIMRWVDPQHIGIWQSLLLIETYSAIAQAGVFNGLNRELPFRLGKGDSRAIDLVSTGQGFAYLVVGLLLVGGGVSVFFSHDPQVRYVLPAVFLVTACDIYVQFMTTTYRAGQSFQKLAVVNVIEAVTGLVTLPLVYFLHYPGLPLRYMTMGIVAVAARYVWRPYRVKSQLKLKNLGALLAVGLPLYLLGYILTISATLPRVILLSRGNLEMVGTYAPASAMIVLMYMIPASIAQYVYPRMSHRLGETGDSKSLWPMAWKTSFVFMAFAVPAAVVGVFVAPLAVKAFLPNYLRAIPAVKWTLISGVFLGASISASALQSLKAWRWLSVYSVSRLLMSAVLPLWFFYVFADHVEGVAFGYAIAQSVSFLVALFCIRKATIGGREHR